MSRRAFGSTWRVCLEPLRQEASAKGFVTLANLRRELEELKAQDADMQDYELVEDLAFLVQQLRGPQASVSVVTSDRKSGDSAAHIALCRLLVALSAARTLRLHGPAANLVLGTLRQWADTAPSNLSSTAAACTSQSVLAGTSGTPAAAASGGCASSASGPEVPGAPPQGAAAAAPESLPVEALAALAALLPGHLGLLSEHERAAQLAALLSLIAPPQPQRVAEAARGRPADILESQTLALTALAACCSRATNPAATPAGGPPSTGTAAAAAGAASNSSPSPSPSLTPDEVGAVLSAVVSLLQSCAARARPVEDSAHSRLYAALVRALQTAVTESKQAWVPRAAMLVEGLQRFFTYGVQASLAAASASSAMAAGQQAAPQVAPSGTPSGGRYRPPHLRRRGSQADGGAGAGCSDSDLSETEREHTGGGGGSGGSGTVVDRFRSSRVRLAVLTCIQAMAKSDSRAMHVHWTALLPLHAPLQPRPLTPHLLTVLVYDPLLKVRALTAATISTLVDGPAPRAILAVAEAKSMSSRPPVRGFLTLSLSLGQLLLGAHAGLLHAVAHEGSALVLPGLLRALVVLMAATPYERLPPELLPEVLKVLRTRWAALSSLASASVPAGELAPIHAAYLASLAECFSTKQPVAGLAAYLLQQQQQQQTRPVAPPPVATSDSTGGGGRGGEANNSSSSSNSGGGNTGSAGDEGGPDRLVAELLAVARNPAAAAVLRIEALAALKGLAAHYTFAMPQDVWEDLRAAVELGLSGLPPPSASPSRTPSRTSSSTSLSGIGGTPGGFRPHAHSSDRPGQRAPAAQDASWGPAAPPSGPGQGQPGTGVNISPEDKAAQLSVKLVSEYMAATARQCGISRVDLQGSGAGDEDSGGGGGGAGSGPAGRNSAGHVPSLGPVASRQSPPPPQQQQLCPTYGAAGGGEGERQAAVQRLAGMWRDAVTLLVPAATGHVSYMVRSAGLSCLGEIPEPVFSSLPPQLQQRAVMLLCDAAASDAVPAVRAAACKALGAAAAFPPVLAHADLCDGVMRALLAGLRDTVQSVRIAAGWAVANLCDAHRRRMEGKDEDGDTQVEGEDQELLRERINSHGQTSTSASDAATAAAGAAHDLAPAAAGLVNRGRSRRCQSPPLEAHHYRHLLLLCGAAITATQDADKVRANGIRAVGNLLSVLTPDMAPGLEAAGGGNRSSSTTPNSSSGGGDSRRKGIAPGGGRSSVEVAQAGSWRQGKRQTGEAASASGGSWRRGSNTQPAVHHGAAPAERGNATGAGGASFGGVDVQGVLQLDGWLDSALSCLQSSLTTGGMKVQWNACYAALGLLRNSALLAHPRVSSRTAPLLLLLVMLVRESGNFKIRTHAAAALAALPTRESYGDVLPDALLVVAVALEGLSGGGVVSGAAAAGGGGASGAHAVPTDGKGGGGTRTAAAAEQGEGGAEGDGGEGRFPNYRYTAGLSAQLRSTLLHLLALAQPADARRVRDALARRAEFLHGCLREQLAEAVQTLRGALPAPFVGPGYRGECGGLETARSGGGSSWQAGANGRTSAKGGGVDGEGRLSSSTLLDLPSDPFGLSVPGSGRGASPRDATSPGGLAGLLAGIRLGDAKHEAAVPRGNGLPEAQSLGKGRTALSAGGGGSEGVGDGSEEELRRAKERVSALAAPLRGFAGLLTQLGPACEAVLRDVQSALGALESGAGSTGHEAR